MFTDPKTTITGVLTFVATLLAHFNIAIPASFREVIIAVGVLALGLLARDSQPKE
jgi:hypothetical protein